MRVIPGSEGLWLVQSLEKAGIRERPSWTRSSHFRSSRLSNSMGTLLLKRCRHSMGAATNQESAGFLGAGPIGNRVHAQFTYVTDSRNILDQFEQIGAVGIPAK